MNDPLDMPAGDKTIPVRGGQSFATLELTPVPEVKPAPPARKEKPTPAPAAKKPAPEAPGEPVGEAVCPKCGGKLINPDSLGWCMACGYCRSTAEESGGPLPVAPKPVRKRQHSGLGAIEFFQVLTWLPRWFWLLVFGVVVVVHGAIFLSMQLPAEGRERAVWSVTLIVAAFTTLMVAQLWAVFLIGSQDERLGARDVLIPFRLWGSTIRRLPASCYPVCLGVWAVTLLICACTVVGGLSYWIPKAPQKAASHSTFLRG